MLCDRPNVANVSVNTAVIVILSVRSGSKEMIINRTAGTRPIRSLLHHVPLPESGISSHFFIASYTTKEMDTAGTTETQNTSEVNSEVSTSARQDSSSTTMRTV